ncbi:LacI family DNA-binding transcriptional regulator [Austwickia sp. TVS 96-490-7B]|uniref:LacI family DNA-binding transcriptional regulator n=1 Tax=Austwickia sp. TVS 96-490-7B TaxID=2830843 RepID=UPI0021027953|nr:LacI family DNA-binding transcriptional regulator [Austwickia sp. TVS 96-490-7B]
MTMVAREAGVSVSTVSHVVNGTRPVNAQTRRLVLATMDRLGFQHRPVAGSLAAGSTSTIGLAMSPSVNPALRELADGVEEEASRRGLQMMLVDTHDDPVHEARVVANLLAHHVDGLLIAPTRQWEEGTLKRLRERNVPFVVVDRLQDARADQVGVENQGAATSLVEHLMARGHTRIAFVGGWPETMTWQERQAGYVEAHRRRGIPVCPELVSDDNTGEEGMRKAVAAMLASAEPPTAVFAGGHSATLGTLRAARAAGLSIPQDLAVVAFDEVPWAGVADPAMTILAQPWFAIGARAVQLLERRMHTPDAPPQTLRLAGEIVHRRSCGCDGSARS